MYDVVACTAARNKL